jgi:transposase
MLADAVTGGSSSSPWSLKTVRKQDAPPVVPSNPNSRQGRSVSPIRQGWETMEIYVGIDVSKDRLDICILPQDERFNVTREARGLEELTDRLKAVMPRLVVLEATGGLETVVVATLSAAGLGVAVVNPRQVRHFAIALNQHAKSDPIDAHVLARFGAAVKPEARDLPDEMTRLLSGLVSRRRQLIEMIVMENQRLSQSTQARVKKSHTRVVKALEKEKAELEEQIDRTVRGSPIWREKEDLLSSVPGVGSKTARVLLCELPELGALDRRQVASLAGLAPYVRQSGKWKGKSVIAGGRAPVRSALYMAALSASRYNPVLKPFYQRLLQSGKPKMVALIAVARRLLTALNAILRDGRPWRQPAEVPA